MDFFKKIFRRKREKKDEPKPQPLRIEGCKTTLTPKPDDAELAAQALLESRIYGDKEQRRKSKTAKRDNDQPHDAAYYRNLSEKIKAAHEADKHAAMRHVAYCEEQLKLVQDSGLRVQDSSNHDLLTVNHAPESIATLERGLYKHQDAAEREGGDLLKRWQKCLALVVMKQYKTKTNTDLTDGADEHQPSDI